MPDFTLKCINPSLGACDEMSDLKNVKHGNIKLPELSHLWF